MGSEERFLLKQSWPYFRLYLLIAAFPCRRITRQYHDFERKELKRLSFKTFAIIILFTTGLTTAVQIGVLNYCVQTANDEKAANISVAEISWALIQSANKTPTDTFTSVSTLVIFALLYWIVSILNYTIGKDIQPLLDLFSSMEVYIANSDLKRDAMKTVFRWLKM